MTNGEKAQAMLASPAGCALILDVSENSHLPLEYFAQPMESFWLAASAIDWCDWRRGKHGAENRSLALADAQDHTNLALQIVSDPAFDWWYEPLDLNSQIWVSPQMPHGSNFRYPEPDPFDPKSWRPPGTLDGLDLEGDPVPDTYAQNTSTLRGITTSQITAYANYVVDHISHFPLAAWQLQFQQDVRVWEINHPADWHTLCLEFPHHAPDGRLQPNWPEVSEKWDGIHITLSGMLTCEQVRYEMDGEWSMMQFWHSEETKWLNRLQISGKRMPDFQREAHRLDDRLRRFPYRFKPGP
ncbi:MAG: hypothetical protein OXF79_17120 [Chloroflexi bacterium]|nr:hypothetical protein [Chloroflexota bacterium]